MRNHFIPFCLLFAACDDAAETEPTGTDDGFEVRARIGPEGGTLDGPAGTEWADFRLEVPPGALAEATEVVLRPVFDGVPLGPTAERVGLQVEVTAEGDFAAPVRLVLPFDAGAVGRVDQDSEDVKVWVRADEGWTLVEPVAAAAETVTIELTAPTVAAAGVRLVPAPPTCAECGAAFATHRNPDTCADSGLCLPEPPEDFATLGPAHIISPRDHVVAWLLPSGTDLIAEGFDLIENVRHQGARFSPQSSVVANPALGADGVVRMGLGSLGSARVPLLSRGAVVLRSAPGLGAVSLGNGLSIVVEIDAGRPSLAVQGVDDPASDFVPVVINHEEQFAPSVRALPTLQADPGDPDRAFVLSSGALYAFRLSSARAGRVDLVRLADAPNVPAQAPLALATGPNGALAATLDSRGRVLAFIEEGGRVRSASLALPFPAREIVSLDTRLLAASSTTPEIAVVDLAAADLTPQVFALTDAEFGTEAYQAAMPRQLLRSSDKEKALVRQTNQKIGIIYVTHE